MNPEAQSQNVKPKSKKIAVISLITFILLMLAVTAQLSYTVLGSTKVYNGISINGLPVGELTRNELENALKQRFMDNIAEKQLVLKAGSNEAILKYTDVNAAYDVTAAVNAAFDAGRQGNMFGRLYEVFTSATQGREIEMPVVYDRGKLEEAIGKFYDQTLIPVKEADILIEDDRVVIRSGHHGENIDKNKLLTQAEAMIKAYEDGPLDAEVIVTNPGKIDVENLYSLANSAPVDATFKIENNQTSVVPHATGRSIEKSVLAEAAAALDAAENTEKVLPIAITHPKVTTEMVRASLFRDTLATMNTQFSVSDENNKNRGENIRIAVSKINGKLLAPGDVFSFNEVVGPRTEKGGFKLAHTYVSGKVVDGIGGGICQVSSTLYNSVLSSDLQVVERRNHMFTVGYVPYGTDATVSYGDVDFKFKNSTNWPLRVEAWVTDNNWVYFSLRGTNENPGKKVEISPKIMKTTDFKIKYIDDPTLLEGKTVVKQKGMKGYTVDTYKTVKQDGKVVSQTKLHTSVYRPLDQEVLRGIKKADTPPVTASTSEETPPPVVETPGVDDADNPPAPQ